MLLKWLNYIQNSHQLDRQMFTHRSVKTQIWKHKTEIQTLSLIHLRLCWESAPKVAEKMEELSHLHKYQQPCALAISEAWLDDRAPDGRVVSGSSRAFAMDRELGAMWEHSSGGVCYPIRDQWCKSAAAIEMRHSPQNAILAAQAQLLAPGTPFYSFIWAAGKHITFYFEPDLENRLSRLLFACD